MQIQIVQRKDIETGDVTNYPMLITITELLECHRFSLFVDVVSSRIYKWIYIGRMQGGGQSSKSCDKCAQSYRRRLWVLIFFFWNGDQETIHVAFDICRPSKSKISCEWK